MAHADSERKVFSRATHPLMIACIAAALVLVWQVSTVHFNYGGNWSALFRIGDRWPLPPQLAPEGNRIFVNDPGYDGTFYHLVAHDPCFRRGFAQFADNASLRWRRILVPAMAHIVAFGADGWIHGAYVAVNLLFVFAGTCWLARFCVQNGLNPAWGGLFLAVPAVLVSIDRLTVDTALSALIIGVVLYSTSGNRSIILLGILAICPLARETGACAVAGQAWIDAGGRRWKSLVWTLGTLLPFLAWAGFVFSHAPRDGTPWLSWPLAGILHRTMHPFPYAITGRWVATAAVLDYVALIGVWAGLFLTARLALTRRISIVESCACVFSFAAVWLGKEDIWYGAYEFGRTMSPLLVLLGLAAVKERNPLFAIPLALVLPRILLQYQPQLRGILAFWS